MQNFLQVIGAHGGGEIISIVDANSKTQIFTTGSDNTIWNYYFDQSSESGFQAMSTGLVGKSIAATLDEAGNVLLFGTSNVTLSYVQQSLSPAGVPVWSSPKPVRVPMPTSPLAITKVFTGKIGDKWYVGVLTEMKSTLPGNLYAFSYSVWSRDGARFKATSLKLSTLNCFWSGTSAETAEFVCLDVVYLGYNIASQGTIRYPMAATFTSTAVAAVPGVGFFAILDDGNLYRLVGGAGSTPYSWAQMTQQMSLREVRAGRDASGQAQLFVLSTNNTLYHLQPEGSERWTTPAPIRSGVALLSLTRNDAGATELFLVGAALGALTHMILAASAQDWEVSSVAVPSSGEIEEIRCYATDVIVLDAKGARLPGVGVEIRASSRAVLTISGSTYIVDAKRPASLTTNGAGMISVTQQTSRLGVPSLAFSVVGRQASASSIAVQQFAGVQARLDAVTGPDLLSATVANGAPLLGDAYRTPETAASLSKAFNSCMSIAGGPALSMDRSGIPHARIGLGVLRCPPDGIDRLHRVAAHPGSASWQIDFSSGQPVYRDLSHADARALLVERQAMHAAADVGVGGFFDVFETIGDLVEGILEGIVDVVEAIVTTVGDAVNAAITFIVDGATYLFNAAITVIEQAFDLVQAVFAKVKVFFEEIFEWLAFLFNWKDILRTKKALVYTANQFLGFMQQAPLGLQRIVDSGIATASSQVDAVFDALVAQLTGASLGGYVRDKQPSEPRLTAAVGNNIVLNGTIDHSATASVKAPLGSPEAFAAFADGGPFGDVIAQLEKLVAKIAGLPEFQQALTYMQNLGGSPDQIFQQLLAALLRIVQGIIKAILAGVQTVVNLVLQMMSALVSAVQGILNASWDIPFVSALYKWIGEDELTTLDLLALIIAIPSTVLYKAIEGASPFPDGAALSAFEATFSAASILSASGLGGAPVQAWSAPEAPVAAEPTAARPDAAGPSAGVLLLGIAGVISTFVFGSLSAIMDANPSLGTGQPDPAVKTLSKFALGAEIIAQAAATPWITSRSAPDCTTADGASQILWICESVGVLLDIGFVIKDSAFPENENSDFGIWVSFAYGCCHALTFAVVARNMSGLGIASKICMLIPELGKPLRLQQIETATEGISLAVIAGLDAIGFTASAILSFADSLKTDDRRDRLAVAHIPGAVMPA